MAAFRILISSVAARSMRRERNGEDWRRLMPRVREVAAVLVYDGKLVCIQRGLPSHPLSTRGAIRLARGRTF
jgi:hypothetical protein